MDPLPRLRKTLAELPCKKREHYGLDHPDFYESDLRNLFSDSPAYAKTCRRRGSSGGFARRRTTVASFTDSYQHNVDQLLEKIIERCRNRTSASWTQRKRPKPIFWCF